nr:helix-turn-helix domain-containing protein [Sphingomonas sp. Y57]
MTRAVQPLPPKALAFWIRTLRAAADLSQDALAMASGLTHRTIQRVEAGDPSSVTTRRCLARGFGYDDLGIFDDPVFVATVTGMLEDLRAAQIKAEDEAHADRLRIEAVPVTSGGDLVSLLDGVDAWAFDCDEALPAEAHGVAAALFDNLQDYGDIWSELSRSGRNEAAAFFEALLEPIGHHGGRVYQARRATRFVGHGWQDPTPLPMTIGYVTVVPAGRDYGFLMVPKAGRMG